MKKFHIASIFIIVALLAFIGGIFLRKANFAAAGGSALLIEKYESFPPEFPRALVAEPQAPVIGANVVTLQDGRKTTTVSFASPGSIVGVMGEYESALKGTGWTIQSSNLGLSAGTITATNLTDSVTISMAPQGPATVVTISLTE